VPTRERYVYLPGGGPIVTLSPFLGIDLVADIEVTAGADASGVICAHRNLVHGFVEPGGWACYVTNDGRLVVAVSGPGGPPNRILSEATLAGKHEVRISSLPDEDDGLTFKLTLDGHEAGACFLASDRRMLLVGGKLFFGCDTGVAVSDDYQSPFPFSGKIHRAVLTVPASPTAPPPRDQLEAALEHE
jgi:hypothetical protein